MMKKMSNYHKVHAQCANPVNFLLHIIGVAGAAYYLWLNNWQWAVLFGVLLPLVGHIYAWINEKGKAPKMTMLREIMLGHAEPVNATMHLIGAVLAVYGFWHHDYYYLAGALIVIAIGHLFGTTLMTQVTPKMIKRLNVLDLALVKYSSMVCGLIIGAYAHEFIVGHIWWFVAAFFVLLARPFAHFFLND